jgi:hypothetical protein
MLGLIAAGEGRPGRCAAGWTRRAPGSCPPAGEHDAMVSTEQLRALHPEVAVLAGAGHNAHVEDPEAVCEVIGRTLGGAATGR